MNVGHPADVGAAAHVFVAALDDRCEVAGPDGHHLQRVRRLRAGEVVTAADGTGAWRPYEITEARDGTLVLAARDGVRTQEPSPPITLAVAALKTGLDDVVASVTELGVRRITVVRTARTVARWDGERGDRALARLRVAAREAAMQSRNARIPQVDGMVDFASVADRPGLVIAHRVGSAACDLALAPDEETCVLVGPEGGLAPEELERVVGAPRLAVGCNVLRGATAAVAAVAALLGRARPG